tara:strand:+ start:10167 stop:10973 length:807 start_codon:yes stop_codon:yes gene_type:complete
MGAAEIIPGISGGTIALILGIYKRLIIAISSIDRNLIKKVVKFEFRNVWTTIDGNFLLFLGLGMASSVYILSNLIMFLMLTLPIFFKSFLSSLLFSSLFIEPLKQEPRKELIIGLLISGSLCSVILFSPSATFDNVTGFYIFISGFIAISALVVPGISGSFILVLLGSYPFLIEAVSNLEVVRILYFLVGALLGLFTIVRVIRRYYEKNEIQLLSIFFGLVLFSIPLIWKANSISQVSPVLSKDFISIILGLLTGALIMFSFNKLKSN